MTQDLYKFVKNSNEIQIMRDGGKILGNILSEIENLIVPGVATMDLENKFIELCKVNKVLPSCKGYSPYFMTPFPTGLCISINNQCVHCYPKSGIQVKDGDIITVDTVIEHNGYMVDSSFGKAVGNVDEKGFKLVTASKKALEETIKAALPSNRVGDLSSVMFKQVKSFGFDVLRDYAGHGIGRHMHEFPEIACYGKPNTGHELVPGLTICIEALVCEGKPNVISIDDWETQMEDGKRFVQFEHTVLITESGPEILTSRL